MIIQYFEGYSGRLVFRYVIKLKIAVYTYKLLIIFETYLKHKKKHYNIKILEILKCLHLCRARKHGELCKIFNNKYE